MRSLITSLLLAVIILTPLVPAQEEVAGWSQLRGGAHNPGVAETGPEPLDVVATRQVLESGEGAFVRSNLIATPRGLATDVGAEQGCWFIFVDVPADQLEQTPRRACPYGGGHELFAYDPVRDSLLVCVQGRTDTPILQARSAIDGSVLWNTTPEAFGAVGTGSQAGPLQSDLVEWHCTAGAIDVDRREVVVGVHALGGARGWVASVDADTGNVRWSRATPATAVAGQGDLPGPAASGALDPARDAGFEADEVTITQAGIAVSGDIGDQAMASVWLDRAGRVIGGASAQEEDPDGRSAETSVLRRTGAWAGDGGPLAATLLGDRLLVVNPATPVPILERTIEPVEPTDEQNVYPWPAWWQETIIVPMSHSVLAFEASTLQPRWTWFEGLGTRISDVVISPPLDAYVLVSEGDPEQAVAKLVRVDLRTGQTVSYRPLPVEPTVTSQLVEGVLVTRWFATLSHGSQPGLVVLDRAGQFVTLGEAPAELVPALSLSATVPEVRAEVTVTPEAPADGSPDGYLVHWSEGSEERIEPGGSASFQYATPGPRTIRVTAIYADGRTATAEERIDVGGSPPRKLNAIQEIFAPEHQDLTFGVLGIALALGGGGIALARNRARRRRVEQELAAIETAYAGTLGSPAEAEAALAERRARVRGLGLDGRLDQGEVLVLERRIDELSQRVRIEAVDEQFGFLTVSMARMLRELLSDGRLSSWERDHLLEAVGADEHMTPEQKQRVREQIDAWFGQDTSTDA